MEHRWSKRQRFNSTSACVDCPVVGIGSVAVRDMGIGGMFIETDLLVLPLHAPVLIGFSLSRDGCSDEFLLDAMVVRREANGAALMFLDMEDEVTRALHAALFGSPQPRAIQSTTPLWVSRSDLRVSASAMAR